jgi:integrase/recombinase XerD
MTPLRQRMIEDMQIRNLSVLTQASYVQQVSLFARHFNKSPELLGPEQIRAYQVYLTNEKKLATSSMTISIAALRFLYKVTLKRNWSVEDIIPTPKKPQKLPIVLSPEEVVLFLGSVASRKHRTILTTCYAAGLRVSEAVALTLPSIDSQRMVLRVEQGKGQKDRYVMLSPKLLEFLRDWWRVKKPKHWLFPSCRQNQHISRYAVERACQKAHRVCKIPKPITPHSLRHAFAVHLFAPFSCYSAIAAWRPQQSISASRPAKCARPRAHWICCLAQFRWRPSLHHLNTSNRRARWIAPSWKWRTSSAATAKPIVNSMMVRSRLPSDAS